MNVTYLLLLSLLDGLNICMLSLTALLISLMYSMDLERGSVIILGMTFLFSTFTAYFLTGLGLLQTLLISTMSFFPQHLMSRASAAIMIFIGGANITNYFIPELIPVYNVFKFFRTNAIKCMKLMTLSGIIAAGFLTGMHNLPCACTGGVYLTFLSAIAHSQFRVVYLLVYDFLFLVPSLTILAVSTDKKLVSSIRNWLHRRYRTMKLLIGSTMVFTGLIILIIVY